MAIGEWKTKKSSVTKKNQQCLTLQKPLSKPSIVDAPMCFEKHLFVVFMDSDAMNTTNKSKSNN
jgi:hypothetical protein